MVNGLLLNILSQLLLSFLDNWKNPRLALIRPVGAYSQADLVGIGVIFEVFGQLEYFNWRCNLNIGKHLASILEQMKLIIKKAYGMTIRSLFMITISLIDAIKICFKSEIS